MFCNVAAVDNAAPADIGKALLIFAVELDIAPSYFEYCTRTAVLWKWTPCKDFLYKHRLHATYIFLIHLNNIVHIHAYFIS